MDKLSISIYGKTLLSSTFMCASSLSTSTLWPVNSQERRGQIVIPTPAKVLAAEEIVDRWYDLVPREGKAKDKDNVAGKVLIEARLLFNVTHM